MSWLLLRSIKFGNELIRSDIFNLIRYVEDWREKNRQGRRNDEIRKKVRKLRIGTSEEE